ncbi:MAG TPA: hypothetical protein VF677_14435 [Flavobacterium sp.]|jgi:hypothetical protein
MENKENKIKEDKTRDIDPNDIDFKHPAKKEQANESENISEWHQKNDISQTLYQENSDPTISQIDKGTVALQEEKLEKKDNPTAADKDNSKE